MNGSRSSPTRRRLRLAALIVAVIGVLALAAAVFVLSYPGARDTALNAGVSKELARIYPGLFDAVLVIAGAAALALRGVLRAYAWLTIFVLTAAIAAANATHAMAVTLPKRPMEATVAAVPWAVLLIGFTLLYAMARQARPSKTPAPHPVPLPPGKTVPLNELLKATPGQEPAAVAKTPPAEPTQATPPAKTAPAETTPAQNTPTETAPPEPTPTEAPSAEATEAEPVPAEVTSPQGGESAHADASTPTSGKANGLPKVDAGESAKTPDSGELANADASTPVNANGLMTADGDAPAADESEPAEIAPSGAPLAALPPLPRRRAIPRDEPSDADAESPQPAFHFNRLRSSPTPPDDED